MRRLLKNFKHWIRALYLYLIYHKEINHLYGYWVKEGRVNEDANWVERTYFWLMAD